MGDRVGWLGSAIREEGFRVGLELFAEASGGVGGWCLRLLRRKGRVTLRREVIVALYEKSLNTTPDDEKIDHTPNLGRLEFLASTALVSTSSMSSSSSSSSPVRSIVVLEKEDAVDGTGSACAPLWTVLNAVLVVAMVQEERVVVGGCL